MRKQAKAEEIVENIVGVPICFGPKKTDAALSLPNSAASHSPRPYIAAHSIDNLLVFYRREASVFISPSFRSFEFGGVDLFRISDLLPTPICHTHTINSAPVR